MSKNNGKKFALGTLIAAIVGYLTGILTAPKSGRETRQDIQDTAIRTRQEAEKQLKHMYSELDELISRGRKGSEELTKKAEKDWKKAVSAAGEAKDKVREVLSAIHEGGTDNEDLDKAIKDASDAVSHLKDYLNHVRNL